MNERQKSHLVTKIKRYFKDLNGKHFAIWGLAFKPNTDDHQVANDFTRIMMNGIRTDSTAQGKQ